MSDDATDVAVDEAEDTEAAPSVELLYGVPVAEAFGQRVLFPDLDGYIELLAELREQGFGQVVDLCVVDYLQHERTDLPATVGGERFEIVVNLISHARRERIRVRVQAADGVEVPSLFDLYPGTEAMEREAFDMFGTVFSDHPDMSRILMPEEWSGHPLRKDYEIGRIPVQFKGAPSQG